MGRPRAARFLRLSFSRSREYTGIDDASANPSAKSGRVPDQRLAAPIWLTCAGWGLTEDVTSAPGTNAPPTMPEPYAAVVALPKGYDTGGEYLRWAKQEAENLAREARQATEAPPRRSPASCSERAALERLRSPGDDFAAGSAEDPSIGDESSLMELLEVAEKLLDEAEADGGSAIEEEGDARRGQRGDVARVLPDPASGLRPGQRRLG